MAIGEHKYEVPADSSAGTRKRYRNGTERSCSTDVTVRRARSVTSAVGITRVANITGLDRIGIPVFAVHRPNSRSLSVSQGKGVNIAAAQASGLMESIESYHAENLQLPLLHGSHSELSKRHRVVQVHGLPKVSASRFNSDLPMLWVAGSDLMTGQPTLVPYELVHTDFRIPLPTGSGAFIMSSNGLASGNHISEAVSHAICELVERDANTLWRYSGSPAQRLRTVDLATVDDENCRQVIRCFDSAKVDIMAWETTSDVTICSYLCTIVDRDDGVASLTLPVTGSGCHPRRSIALLRALTEAAQGRLTLISGSRDDLSESFFSDSEIRNRCANVRRRIAENRPKRIFQDAPDCDHSTFEEDVRHQLECLAKAGMKEVIVVNLTQPDFDIPVVRVIIPYLESISEVKRYVPGIRAQKAMSEATQCTMS